MDTDGKRIGSVQPATATLWMCLVCHYRWNVGHRGTGCSACVGSGFTVPSWN